MHVTLAYAEYNDRLCKSTPCLCTSVLKTEFLSSLYQNNFCSDNENAMMSRASNHIKAKVLKIGQNLYKNINGFHRTSHNCINSNILTSINIEQTQNKYIYKHRYITV